MPELRRRPFIVPGFTTEEACIALQAWARSGPTMADLLAGYEISTGLLRATHLPPAPLRDDDFDRWCMSLDGSTFEEWLSRRRMVGSAAACCL